MLFLVACASDPAVGPNDTAGEGFAEHVDQGVVLGEVVACADAAPTTTYSESGEAWGLKSPENVSVKHEESPSVAAGDFDGDGLDDLVIVNIDGKSHAYRNTGAGFEVSDLSAVLIPSLSILLHDVDGDGDLDLMTGGSAPTTMANVDGSFSRGDPLPNLPSWTAHVPVLTHDFSPGDIDGDGVVEFYLPLTYNFTDETNQYNDLLLVGANSQYAYEDVVPGGVGFRHGLDAVWFDADGDHDEDVYVVNDFGMLYGPSTLLRNDDGALVSAEADCYCNVLTNAKGVDIGDYNADGRPDILVSSNPTDALLRQLDDGTWVDVTTVTNAGAIDEFATGWGAIFLDFDNDGQRDLFPAQGDRWNEGNDHPHFDAPLKLLRQDEGVFADAAADMGIAASGSFRAVSALDFNGDGVEDLIATSMDDRPLFYLSDGCTEAGWVEIEAPVGSKVVVESGGHTQTNWVKTDAGYQSHRPARVHFGLGSRQTIDRLTVTLLGGTTLGATGIDARRRIVIGG